MRDWSQPLSSGSSSGTVSGHASDERTRSLPTRERPSSASGRMEGARSAAATSPRPPRRMARPTASRSPPSTDEWMSTSSASARASRMPSSTTMRRKPGRSPPSSALARSRRARPSLSDQNPATGTTGMTCSTATTPVTAGPVEAGSEALAAPRSTGSADPVGPGVAKAGVGSDSAVAGPSVGPGAAPGRDGSMVSADVSARATRNRDASPTRGPSSGSRASAGKEGAGSDGGAGTPSSSPAFRTATTKPSRPRRKRPASSATRRRDAISVRRVSMGASLIASGCLSSRSSTTGGNEVWPERLADPTGFEPAISSVTGWHVGPLHHGSRGEAE